MRAVKRLLLYALAGLLLGTPLDALHVATGVLEYKQPFFWQQAWWVPLLYAGAGVALCEGVRCLNSFYKARPAEISLSMSLWSLLVLVFVYASSGFLKDMPFVAIVIYVLIFAIASYYLWPAPKKVLALAALGAAILGPLVEILLSTTEQFRHLQPDIWMIPAWLPFIYINAVFIAVHYDALVERLLGKS